METFFCKDTGCKNPLRSRIRTCSQRKEKTAGRVRFSRTVQAFRHALKEGRFGTLSHGSINVYWNWNRNRDYYTHDSWRGTWKDDGGCLLNQCIHGADLLR